MAGNFNHHITVAKTHLETGDEASQFNRHSDRLFDSSLQNKACIGSCNNANKTM